MSDRSTKPKVDVLDDPLDVNIVGGDITISGADGAIVDGASAAIRATVKDLTNSNPLTVAITDGNGDQITSFGGGTQYTEGDTDATITGTAMLFEGAANALVVPSSVNPLPVSATIDTTGLALAANQLPDGHNVTVDNASIAVTGTFWQATQPVSVATVPAHDVTNAGTFAVQVTSAPSTVVTATDLDIRNLAAANDTVVVTGGASQTADVKVTLDGESVPVTGTFWQATQPVSGTFWQATQPVSGTVTAAAQPGVDIGDVTINNATIAVTQSGTWDEVGINDSGNSITIDAPVGTPAFVRLSDGAAAITTLPVSLASVPSHAVTNAGTFAVQSTNQANSGVDIGDVTINNAAGAAAVNIQDGGNTITVDGTVSVTGSTVQDIPATSGGLSKFHLVGAATTNATNVKASAGQVYAITAFNIGATPIYVKLHNTSGTPTAGSGVTDTFLVPGNTAGAGMVINFDKGIAFSTGIGVTTVTGITDASAVAIAADTLMLNIYYK